MEGRGTQRLAWKMRKRQWKDLTTEGREERVEWDTEEGRCSKPSVRLSKQRQVQDRLWTEGRQAASNQKLHPPAPDKATSLYNTPMQCRSTQGRVCTVHNSRARALAGPRLTAWCGVIDLAPVYSSNATSSGSGCADAIHTIKVSPRTPPPNPRP